MMRKRSGSAATVERRAAAPTLIFLHVPKTGGITMRRIIRRNYRPDERYELMMQDGDFEASLKEVAELPDEAKGTVRVVFGHTTYGVHESLLRPATYATMLRRPTSLALSAYNFIRRRQSNWLHDQVTAMTLEEFIRSDIAREGDNMQTRLVAGQFDWSDVCTEETLELAKRNIEEHFSGIGLTERFDETVLLWAERFGWTRRHYVRWNVTPKKAKAPVSDEIVRLIEERNRYDLEFYRFVADRFEKDLAAHPSVEEGLARFQRRNRLYGMTMRIRPAALARRARRLAGR